MNPRIWLVFLLALSSIAPVFGGGTIQFPTCRTVQYGPFVAEICVSSYTVASNYQDATVYGTITVKNVPFTVKVTSASSQVRLGSSTGTEIGYGNLQGEIYITPNTATGWVVTLHSNLSLEQLQALGNGNPVFHIHSALNVCAPTWFWCVPVPIPADDRLVTVADLQALAQT